MSRSLLTPQARSGLPIPRSGMKRGRDDGSVGGDSAPVAISIEDETTRTKRENRALLYQIQMLKTQAEKSVLGWERTKAELEEVVKDAKRRAESAERDRAFLLDQARVKAEQQRQKGGKNEEEEDAAMRGTARDVQAELLALRKASSQSRDTYIELLEEKRNLESTHMLLQQSSETTARSLETRIRQLEASLALQMSLVEQKDRTLQELETKANELEQEITSLRQEHVDSGNVSIIRNELSRQVTHLRSLESTNRRLLREMAEMKIKEGQLESMKEMNSQLTTKCSTLDSVQAKLNKAEMTIANLTCEKEAWSCFLPKKEAPHLDTPKKVTQKLAMVQGDLVDAQQIANSSKAQVESREKTIEGLEDEIRTLTVDLHESRQLCRKLEERSRRLEKQRQLGMQESRLLRDQLATYDQENSLEGGKNVELAARVESLEKLLEEYKAAYKVENESSPGTETIVDTISQEISAKLRSENKTLQDLLSTAQRKADLLQTEVTSLENQLGIMQKAIGSGAYDHQTTKVLALADNPASRDLAVRSEALERLKRENVDLLRTIEEMSQMTEPGSVEILANVPQSTATNLRKEIEQLQESLATKDKRMQRLLEVYKEKSKEFRQAVKSLLGYKMEFLENGRVRLYSAFAHSSLSLTFTPPTGGADGSGLGAMELTRVVQENEQAVDGSEGLENLRRFWVNERQCIPGFLASLTLELYEQTTRGQAAGWAG